MSEAPWLHVVGVGDGGLDTLTPEQRRVLDAAQVVFGGRRHLAMLPASHPARRVSWRSPFADSQGDVEAARGQAAAVLATGDPSWFGPARWLRSFLQPSEMRVLPAPSAFSLAAAQMGWALEEVRCVTAHGRPLADLAPHLVPGARLLVLAENGATAAQLAEDLARRGLGGSRVAVLEHLGGAAERVREAQARDFALTDIADLATLAVECVADPGTRCYPLVAGLPDEAFRHDGKMTKRVLRALAVSALEPRPGALLWDVGAGSGSIGVEWLRLAAGGRAIAIEPVAERREMIGENAARLGAVGLQVVAGRAPDAFAALPAPDAVFIGGGLTDGVFHAAFNALRPGGVLVAHAVTLESEHILLALHEVHGGELLRVGVDRAEPVGPYRGWRPAMPVLHWHLHKAAMP